VGQSFPNAIHAFSPALPVAVAYSGGADSTALLLACAEKWPGQVVALHVHHGLQAAADGFASHCESVCARLGVPLHISRVDGRHAPGQSPEDAARRARYGAFKAIASVQHTYSAINNIVFKSIAIAQHADDQVETIVLALSRGAGLAGLSAMPAQWQRDGIGYHRPLLGVSAADIRAWLATRAVPFIEDPTNADEKFTRNRIRARILPVLQEVFPHFRDTFARSAGHAAQAQEILNEVGLQDFAAIASTGPGQPLIVKLQNLSLARQANVLRHWLKTGFNVVPSAAQLDELLHQVAACTTRGHQINVKVGNGFVKRQGDVLAWYNP
jgi:tRNA(Ile)-lysidine synthase